jgi:hypothetical protein
VALDGPFYLVRADGRALVAVSITEVCELMVCAQDADDQVEAIHAYYSVGPFPTAVELDQISRVLGED